MRMRPRASAGAQMVGLAQGALDLTLPYVHERRQFGSRIADFQAVQHTLAQAWCQLEPSPHLGTSLTRRPSSDPKPHTPNPEPDPNLNASPNEPTNQAATEVHAARLVVYNAARMKEAGLPVVQEAAMAKLLASQVADRQLDS